ncbi:hypothetical protein [Pelomonas sp. KK5]|uniref:hypothetical protein n=1 Tax=Pelomonas sp. KK5 TaxID=1855730 RepID=UPI00117FC4BB|nr:hypothetical protein [Pelomonas sp. KK5]
MESADSNRYAPPQADVDLGTRPAAGAASFPWLMVSRWLLGLALLVSALLGLYQLQQHWGQMANDAVIDPGTAPVRYLPAALLKLGTALAILARSRWSIALALAWTAAFCWLLNRVLFTAGALPMMLEQLALVAFLCLLALKGRLR